MPLIGSIRPLQIAITWDEVTGKIECQMDRAVPFPALVGVFCTVQMQLAQGVLAGVATNLRSPAGLVGGTPGGPVAVPPAEGNGNAT